MRDEIRSLEQEELGLPPSEHKAPIMGRSNEGKPGTRKTRYGKSQKMRAGMPGGSAAGALTRCCAYPPLSG